MRSVLLARKGWSDQEIFARISEVFPGYKRQVYLQIIALARQGVAFAQAIDWSDPSAVVDSGKAPKIPS